MKTRFILKIIALCLLPVAFAFHARAANITWTNTSGGSWSVATNWNPNTVPGAADDVFITSSGTYTVVMNVSPTISSLKLGATSGQQTLTNVSQTLTVSHASLVDTNGILGLNAGTLSGAGAFTVNGLLNWNGGSLDQGGSLTVAANGIMNLPATVQLSGGLTNQGRINWLGGTVFINTSGSIYTGTIWNQAGAVFDIQCDQSMNNGISPGTFHNAGLLRKRVTAGSTTFNVFLDNTGSVQAQTGTIFVSAGVNLGGSFQANSGAAITFNSGTYTLSSPPNFQGPGTVQLSAGSSVTLNAFTGNYSLNGATLVGQNTIASNGIISLNGSDLGAGATLTVLSNGVLNFPATVSLSGVVTNQGTINWLGGTVNINTNISVYTGTIWNQSGALFDIQCDQSMNYGIAPATFHNAGLLRKSASSGTTTFLVNLDNSTGTVQGQTGTLVINSSYTGSAAATLAISLASTNSGTGFGKIQFSTTNSLLGKFNLVTLGGYRPNPGNSFLVLGFPSVTGDFTCMNGLDLGGGLRLAPRPSASGLTLMAASYPVTASPNLILDHSLKGLLVGWPTNFAGWTLQTTTNLAAPSWSTLSVAGTNNTVAPIASDQHYFRLFQ